MDWKNVKNKALLNDLWMVANAKETIKKLKIKLKHTYDKLGQELIFKEIELNKAIIKNAK